jgi:hypothetical protein
VSNKTLFYDQQLNKTHENAVKSKQNKRKQRNFTEKHKIFEKILGGIEMPLYICTQKQKPKKQPKFHS